MKILENYTQLYEEDSVLTDAGHTKCEKSHHSVIGHISDYNLSHIMDSCHILGRFVTFWDNLQPKYKVTQWVVKNCVSVVNYWTISKY